MEISKDITRQLLSEILGSFYETKKFSFESYKVLGKKENCLLFKLFVLTCQRERFRDIFYGDDKDYFVVEWMIVSVEVKHSFGFFGTPKYHGSVVAIGEQHNYLTRKKKDKLLHSLSKKNNLQEALPIPEPDFVNAV